MDLHNMRVLAVGVPLPFSGNPMLAIFPTANPKIRRKGERKRTVERTNDPYKRKEKKKATKNPPKTKQ